MSGLFGRERERGDARGRLYEGGEPGEDVRVPIASALLELYDDPDDPVEDQELAALVEAMLPLELHALGVG